MTAARFPGSSRFTLRVGATYREKLHDGHLGVCARSFAEAASGIRLPTRLLRQPPLPEPELMPASRSARAKRSRPSAHPGASCRPAPASARTQTRSRPASTQRRRRRSSTVLRSGPAAFRRSLRRELTSRRGARAGRETKPRLPGTSSRDAQGASPSRARPAPFHPSGRVQAGGLNCTGKTT